MGDHYGLYQLARGGAHPVTVRTSFRFVEALVLTFDKLRMLLRDAEVSQCSVGI